MKWFKIRNKIKKNTRILVAGIIFFTGLALAASLFLSQVRARADWEQKVDPYVLKLSAEQPEVEFIVVLGEQADLSGATLLGDKVDKGRYVYEQLTAMALRSQPPLLKALQAAGADYRSFWVTNAIWSKGDAGLIEELARRTDVAQIHANPHVQLDLVGTPLQPESEESTAAIEWNIDLVRAPEVWSVGAAGQGIVIGGQDTGYDWQHPALINHYRGWNGSEADHHYNWHDAIHGSGSNSQTAADCDYDNLQPCDDHGHGTHTMGTMVGDDGGSNQIGMAPAAEWIGCRNMKNGVGTPATYAECYEWFIAPYPLGGDPMLDGDPAKAPHVINNSWSCPVSEGCTDPDILKGVVENVRAAGILTVHSAGNDGPVCGSVHEAATIYDASFSVAATNSDDFIASFSARGPVTTGDNNPAKPDISAPGVNVRSSTLGNSYGYLSGTSMAAPHVAGLAALLMSAQPNLIGDVDALEKVINDSAVPLFTIQGCGDDTEDSLPNHVFGWGRIDAKEAYENAVSTSEPPTPTSTPITPTPTNTPVPPTATMTPPSHPLFLPILINQ